MENLSWLLLSVFLCACVCDGYKILTVFPLPSKSHSILGDNMVRHLLDAGHEVWYVTPFIKKDAHPNLHQVDVSENNKVFSENSVEIKQIMDGVLTFQDPNIMFSLMSVISSMTLGNPNVIKIMKEEKFDVVIGEYMFCNLYSTLGAVFESPFIWFSTIEPHWMIIDLVDGPLNPAYNTDYLNGRVAPYSFLDRTNELWTLITGLVRERFTHFYKEEEYYLKLVAPIIKEKGRPVPPYEVLKYNASLVLGNSHVVIGDATSLPQCYKHIGGYHIDDDVKPLPENLKKIMDSAKNGVIYFSMGSNLKSKHLPDNLKKGLLKILGELKQTVIWKFEEELPDLPKNVHLVRWAPQQSILAHPNLVLFVSHGGLLSITEAVHFGVPLITIPVFADQFLNAERAEKKGLAKKVQLSYTMYKDLKVALDEVLSNPKYALKAKELSAAFHDRQHKPKEDLDFWVRHVVRTHGAPHLRSPALRLPLHQRLYLDLLAVVLVSLITAIFVIRWILCKVMTKTSKNSKVKKN